LADGRCCHHHPAGGNPAVGWDNLVYGVLLVLFIIFLPKGILGSAIERMRAQRRSPASR
jgi:branched-chain amino acid transport system permease protein